jgi:hypothetical protein
MSGVPTQEVEVVNDLPPELRSQFSDVAPSAFSVVLTLMGWGALGTLIAQTVPKQRIDRIAVFVGRLNRLLETHSAQLESFTSSTLKGEASERIELLRKGAESASYATTPTRARQLASIVANGFSQDEIAAQKMRVVLDIFDSLTDIEASVLLYFYRNREPPRVDQERQTIAQQLRHEPAIAQIFDGDVAFWVACISRLEARGLVQKSTIWGGRFGDDNWADERKESAEFSPANYAITTLGKQISEHVVETEEAK